VRYRNFERIMSVPRMSRYCTACGGDTKKAMTLYRLNLRLSQEMFTIISCFEIALRNAIDSHYLITLGDNWLKNAIRHVGIFANDNCSNTARYINDAILKVGASYSHPKVVAELGFGFWRYMFSRHQYRAGGKTYLTYSLHYLQVLL
jgi:hypothetical protein